MPAIKFDRRNLDSLPGPAEGKSEVIHWDADLPGLGLRVLATGGRTWIVRYRVGKQSRVVSLAKASALTPAEARKKAGLILHKAKVGQDTRLEIDTARAQASDTFDKLAARYLQILEARRRASYARDVRRYLLTDAAPLHDLPVTAITRAKVAGLLGEIAARAPVAADRCRVALSTLFAWAMKQGLAETNPAAQVARIVEPTARERVLSADELREVWQATEGPSDFNAAVRLLLLTGQRREEVAAMTWDEIDARTPDKALWSLPGARTKNRRGHDVPLSSAALAVLAGVHRHHDRALVFGTGKGGFSGWSKGKAALDARIAVNRAKAAGRGKPEAGDALAPWRIHDLRRSVVTHMAEIGIQPHVIEAVVNHISGHKGGVAGVYNRATYAAEKRTALDRWAAWLSEASKSDGSNVVAFPQVTGAA